jgi:hypothetical protein
MKSTKIVILISAALFFHASPGLTQNNHEVSKLRANNISVHSNNVSAYNPSTSRLGVQFGSGVLFGAVGVFVGGLTGYAASGFEGDDLESLPLLFLGSTVGYLAGTSSGIYFTANSKPYNASFGYILLGGIVGTGVGISGTFLAENAFNGNLPSPANIGITLSSTIIGGIIANSLSIKKRSNQSSALLNITDSNPQLAIPSIKLTKTNQVYFDKIEMRNSYSPSVKLLNISL